MKITKGKLKQIIHEEIQKTLIKEDVFLIEVNGLLAEGKISTKQYGNLILEEVDKEIALLEQGVLDKLKTAGTAAKNVITGAIKAAVQKIIGMLKKGLELAKNAASSVLAFVDKVFNVINKFAKQHPTLFKILAGCLTIVLVAAALGVFDNVAQAAVKVGNRVITADSTDGQLLKGLLAKTRYIAHDNVDVQLGVGVDELISLINKKEVIDLDPNKPETAAITKLANLAIKYIDTLKELAKKDEAIDFLTKDFLEAGKQTTFEIIEKIKTNASSELWKTAGKLSAVKSDVADFVTNKFAAKAANVGLEESYIKKIIKEEIEKCVYS